MAKFDFRILLETIEGKKTSYMSQSFVDTSVDLVLSSSQVYNRITGSVSCSYENQTNFTGDFNTSFTFKDSLILSSSLTGSTDTGSIFFTSLTTEYDRLLRYKFFGEKVCNVLGLPSEQWIYVDQFRLPADDEANYIEGNINAKNINVSENITFANTSNINSDLTFLIDTGSDKHLKFVDSRGLSENALMIGYDVETDVYEITSSANKTSKITMTTGSFGRLNSTNMLQTIDAQMGGSSMGNRIHFRGAGIELPPNGRIRMHDGTNPGPNPINTTQIQYRTNGGISMRGGSSTQMIFISQSRVGIGTSDVDGDDITHTLTVAGDINATGDITANRYITSESISVIHTSSGSTIFGNSSDDSHKFRGSITSSGNISSSGIISAQEFNLAGGGNNSLSFEGTSVFKGSDSNATIQIGVQNSITKIQYGKLATTQQVFKGHITASGDISASGKIITSQVGDESGTHDLSLRGDNVTIQTDNNGDIFFKEATTTKFKYDGGEDSFTFTGNITSSNNISASGQLIAASADFNDGNITNVGTLKLDELIADTTGEVVISLSGIGMAFNVDGGDVYLFNEGGTDADWKYVDAADAVLLHLDSGLSRVGIGTTSPGEKLEVVGNITASGDILNSQFVQMTNSSSVINTFNTSSFQTCKYLLQVISASNIQSSEMLVMQNSSNAFNAEYAQINSGLNLIDFTTEVNNSNVELIGSSSFVNCSVKFVRTII